MATVAHTMNGTVAGKLVVQWAGLVAGDAGEAILPQGPRGIGGCIQFSGTFGGTVTLEKSNDGVTWVPVTDLAGANIAPVAAGFYEFSTAALQLRVSAATGVAGVTAIMVLRG